MHFFDSSSLVKAYRSEVGTAHVLSALQAIQSVAVSRLTQVEVTSTLVRRARAPSTGPIHLRPILDGLNQDLANLYLVVELTQDLIRLAAAMTERHALRSADAVQLACAVTARSSNPDHEPFVFVSSDLELNAAAQAEGMLVADPTTSPIPT